MASNYSGPAAKSTLSGQNSKKSKDSAGVTSGLSERMGFDAEDSGPMVNYTVDPKTGNCPERIKPE